MHISVINSQSSFYSVVCDAARPWAVVECNPETGSVIRVYSRHETYKGACISAGKRVSSVKREVRAILTPRTAAEG